MVSPWKGRGIKGVFIPICTYSKINFLHRLKGLLCISTKAIVRFFYDIVPQSFFCVWDPSQNTANATFYSRAMFYPVQWANRGSGNLRNLFNITSVGSGTARFKFKSHWMVMPMPSPFQCFLEKMFLSPPGASFHPPLSTPKDFHNFQVSFSLFSPPQAREH